MRHILTVVMSLSALTALVLADNPYHPLDVGWQWTYVIGSDNTYSREVVESTIVLGRKVFVLRYHEASSDDYMSVSMSGDLLWHGVRGSSSSVYLDPPIVILKAGAKPGDSWVTSSQAYCDPEGAEPLGAVVDYPVEVLALEEISVPAGVYMALKRTGTLVPVCSEGSGSSCASFGACRTAA